MIELERLPSYRELPVSPGKPPGSSWGLWGDEDQLGTLNLLNDGRTLEAARLVERGAVFPLNLPLEEIYPRFAWRTSPRHHILKVGHELRNMSPGEEDEPGHGFNDRDDYLDGFWLQGGTQWDGLTHVRHDVYGNYNGVPDSDIHGGEGTKLGVDQWARRAIVGRGVLLDLERLMHDAGREYDVTSAHQFTVADLRDAAEWQRVEIRTGDILLINTGWLKHYMDADLPERERLLAWETLRAPGLEQSTEMVEYIWDLHVAALASDTVGVEAIEAGPDFKFILHEHFLPLLGLPLGEFWWLHDLATDCARDGRYAFLLVSVPLNVRGGVGSPPQAVAIK